VKLKQNSWASIVRDKAVLIVLATAGLITVAVVEAHVVLGASYKAIFRDVVSGSATNIANSMMTRMVVALTVLSILFLPFPSQAAEAVQQTGTVMAQSALPATQAGGATVIYANAASASKADIDAAVALALFNNGYEAETDPHVVAQCVAVVVVVAIGAYIYYKVTTKCKKIKKALDDRMTNAPDDKLRFELLEAGPFGAKALASNTNVYAAAIVIGPMGGVPNQLPGDSAEVEIPFSCSPSANQTLLSVPTLVPPGELVSFDEFAQDFMARFGVDVNKTSYGSNGVSVASLSNLTYDNGVLTIRVGTSTDVCTNVLQRSRFPTGPWTPVFTNVIVGGSAHGVLSDNDPYPGSGYYRVVTTSNHGNN